MQIFYPIFWTQFCTEQDVCSVEDVQNDFTEPTSTQGNTEQSKTQRDIPSFV